MCKRIDEAGAHAAAIVTFNEAAKPIDVLVLLDLHGRGVLSIGELELEEIPRIAGRKSWGNYSRSFYVGPGPNWSPEVVKAELRDRIEDFVPFSG